MVVCVCVCETESRCVLFCFYCAFSFVRCVRNKGLGCVWDSVFPWLYQTSDFVQAWTGCVRLANKSHSRLCVQCVCAIARARVCVCVCARQWGWVTDTVYYWSRTRGRLTGRHSISLHWCTLKIAQTKATICSNVLLSFFTLVHQQAPTQTAMNKTHFLSVFSFPF